MAEKKTFRVTQFSGRSCTVDGRRIRSGAELTERQVELVRELLSTSVEHSFEVEEIRTTKDPTAPVSKPILKDPTA